MSLSQPREYLSVQAHGSADHVAVKVPIGFLPKSAKPGRGRLAGRGPLPQFSADGTPRPPRVAHLSLGLRRASVSQGGYIRCSALLHAVGIEKSCSRCIDDQDFYLWHALLSSSPKSVRTGGVLTLLILLFWGQ